MMGTNSCLLFCSAINYVTLLRLVLADNLDLAKDDLSLSTCLATLSLSGYFQGFQVSDGSGPHVPVIFRADSKVTLPKDEKNLALLDSSPPRKASIFMSLGNSDITNLTLTISLLHEIV